MTRIGWPIARVPDAARLFCVALGCAVGLIGASQAQTYPDHPIKLILPFTAGSPNDVIARLIGTPLSERLGQPVIIENHPGGGTTIGVKMVMTAEPDGYTLLFSNSPVVLIVPLVSKALRYDPLKDLTPVATVVSGSNIMVISPDIPAKTVKEFVAYAKAHPGKINFGYGQGTQPQLVGEMFKLATGTNIADIPYKGGAQAIPDLLGGRIQMNIGTISTLAPLIRQGTLRALAVTSTERNAQLPDVPTMAESGLPSVTSVTYYSIFGPAHLPGSVVERLNAAVNGSLKAPDVQAAIARIGFEPHSGTPADFAKLLASERKIWEPIVRKTGFTLN